ncbi:MAG: hypothetical protein EPO21_18050 [Chloroflexota bacterium]|nr:MAG: hypothetical protein EPO21_18050 [Chloroflexota bacterium]
MGLGDRIKRLERAADDVELEHMRARFQQRWSNSGMTAAEIDRSVHAIWIAEKESPPVSMGNGMVNLSPFMDRLARELGHNPDEMIAVGRMLIEEMERDSDRRERAD